MEPLLLGPRGGTAAKARPLLLPLRSGATVTAVLSVAAILFLLSRLGDLGRAGGVSRGAIDAATQDCASAENIADTLISHWEQRINESWAALKGRRAHPDVTAAVSSLGLVVPFDVCYTRMRFRSMAFHFAENFSRHCHSPNTAPAVSVRGHAYAAVWTTLLRDIPEAARQEPFEFLLDLTDGSRNIAPLRELLAMPVLAFGASPHDKKALLIPDPHTMAALFVNTPAGVAMDVLAGFGRSIRSNQVGGGPPWSEKVPGGAYRGTCNPTIDPNNTNPYQRVFPRAQLCASSRDHPSLLLDVGIPLDSAAPCPDDYCEQCVEVCTRVCARCAGAVYRNSTDMRRFKVHLVVDGHGPSYDGMVWKLLSNSAVVFVQPNGRPERLYNMWYWPLLQEGRHYMVATAEKAQEKVGWCVLHDEECKKMAAAAHDTVRCTMRYEVMKSMRLMHKVSPRAATV